MSSGSLALAALPILAPWALGFVGEGPTPGGGGGGGLGFEVVEHRLENGILLLVSEDHRAPIFTIMLWVPAGGRTERPGLTGVSHYLEHAYELGSSKLAPRELSRWVMRLGGSKNAFTSRDYTGYFEKLPSEVLDRVIEYEADRLATLALPPERMARELDVVREERRMRVDDSPAGVLHEALAALAWPTHPYGQPVVGTWEDLAALDADRARAYFQTHYATAQLCYVVCGDVRPEEVVASFERWFSPIPRREPPATEVAGEPPQEAPRWRDLAYPAARLPAVLAGWPVPEGDHPDQEALEVLAQVLGGGADPWLERLLVRERRLAVEVGASLWRLRDPGLFVLSAEANEGTPSGDLLAGLRGAVARLREEGVGEEAVRRAMRALELDFLRSVESTDGRARHLGQTQVTAAGGWRSLERRQRALLAVTAAQVTRVARETLDPRRENVVVRHPGPPPGGTEVGPPAGPASAVGPPEPALEDWGEARRAILAGGTELVVGPRPGLPLVALRLAVRGGSAADPPGKAGLAALAGRLLVAGAGGMSEDGWRGAWSDLGAEPSVSVLADWVSLSATVRREDLGAALGLGLLALARPAVAGEAFQRERAALASAVALRRSRPGELAEELFLGAVHPAGSPYSHAALGTPASIAGLALEDVRTWHVRHCTTGRLVVTLAGEVGSEEARAELRSALRRAGPWPAGGGASAPAVSPAGTLAPTDAPRVLLLDRPGQSQAQVRVGCRAVRRDDPRWGALRVASLVLGGGGLSSRLASDIRTERGLAYAVHSALQGNVGGGHLVVSLGTRSEGVGEAVSAVLRQLERLSIEPIPEAELEEARSHLVASLPFREETSDDLAGLLAAGALYRLGPGHWRREAREAAALPAEAIREALASVMDPGRLTVAVVADAARVREALDGLGLGPAEVLGEIPDVD